MTYSNDAKQELVGVATDTLAKHGAVSEDVAAEMALGAMKAANADFGLAVSGIAGPTGGSEEKPVGMVCFGWATRKGTVTETCLFEGTGMKFVAIPLHTVCVVYWLTWTVKKQSCDTKSKEKVYTGLDTV